jgi:pimeloyl-ACP methyl ester carboxylesterase
MGGSYGTRLGLAYQQLYPQSIRSTILIGLFPPEIRMYEGLVSNMDASLNWLFKTCKNDNQCLQAYPNLEQTFERVLKRLAREPFEYNWGGKSFYLNDQDFLLFVHQSLYERNGLSNLPSLINAVDRGDAATISRFTDQLVLRLRIINLITYWSVMSCDEASSNNKQLMARDLRRNKQYQAGISLLTTDPEVLDVWSGYMNCQQQLTVNDTNIPTLLVSGAFDPVTPPHNAKPLEKRMKAGQFVVFENEGHAPFNSCLFRLMRDFLDQPSAPLQSACSQEEPPWSWR